MRRRQILLDDQAERILASLAKSHNGNRSLAVREVLKTHITLGSFLDQLERFHSVTLRRQKERSEAGFRRSRFTSWTVVKRRNHL